MGLNDTLWFPVAQFLFGFLWNRIPENVIKSAFGKHSVPLYADFPKLLSTACLEGPIQLGSAEVPVHSLKQYTGGSSVFWALKE